MFDASAPLLPLDKAVANAAEGFMKHLEPLHHHHWLNTKTCDFQNSLNDTHFLLYHGELEEPEKFPMAQLVSNCCPVVRVCWPHSFGAIPALLSLACCPSAGGLDLATHQCADCF